ncbi:MAG TPA: ABC-F family ATP-binding cassette domain-containing protein [Actinomycetes bacterium]|nr:ABC-F family ATP-binding cassette domain-containing protein [Actinomycetes bacterium]
MPPAPRSGRNLVNLESVTKAYGTTVLLDAVSLGVGEGDRVGVVGRNGGGKSTLLGVLTRSVPPDTGRVTHTGGLRVAAVGQADDLDASATVRSLVLGHGPAHEWAADARVRDVLEGLFGDRSALDAVLDRPVGPLSGGERRRVALARALVGEHDLLVLDEPTNHLDVEGIDWLARHLSARREAVVVVTHDRWFLDAVCTSTWEVTGGAVHAYEGGYAAYVLARAERDRLQSAVDARRANLVRKELAWLRRGPPARTSKPRFRIDAANALIATEPPARDPVELVRFAGSRLGKRVYDVEDATVEVGGRALLDHLTWQLGPGDRVGVAGVNGSGKTSLLRLLTGELRPSAGRVVTGLTVRPAYLSQAVTELDPALRVLEAVEQVKQVVELGKGRTATASQLCERFGFVGAAQWTPVADLSGGERRRLQLLRLLMDEPNVLLLDEPTNDLDIDTLTALEDLLDGWPGTLLVVSHDRYFLERVCDRTVALLGDGRLRDLPGGVDEYLARRRAVVAAQAAGAAGAAGATGGAGAAGTAAASSGSGGSSGPGDAARLRADRKELARLDRSLDRLRRQEQRLHDDLAAAATDHERVLALDTELRALTAEREALEEQWLEVAERVDLPR